MFAQFAWIVVYGALGAFGFGWGTGANDVGNAFGTSVGAKTLTMIQACAIAAVFEFGGAMVLGRVSTQTIAGSIANPEEFQDNPMIYAYGMASTLFVGTVWLAVASYYGWNVSSTHSIIGGIIGFAWVYRGFNGVNWMEYDPTMWPPYRGILPIVLSWFIAPGMAALAAGIIFGFCRYFVLRHADAERRAIYVAPPLVFLTAFINVYFVFTKGAKKTIVAQNPGWTDRTSVWVSFLIAVGAGLITLAAVPWMRRKILAAEEKKQRDAEERIEMAERAARDALEAEKRKQDSDGTEEEEEGEGQGQGGKEGGKKTRRDYMQMAKKALLHGVTVDIHEIVKTDATVANIHSTAEVFDTRAESIFSYLQVFSAICVMFAHGAAEVGYMSGPLSSIYDIYMNERVDRKLIAPVWITFISAFSLVVVRKKL
ncbi:hypothetical protein NSK_005215 [Nannochloropsis salina CCMP1776]|uniref:Phosphate transporter n=1 Tax=Nannochloropsis salina CCMP1776 TaxID=1027361 RepID=A0A4D9D0L4_9STRA|nr:hypothetical protein NSK_005215 [Nannochloropsis salina CCMP1776]|eukprot:TFJ83483.1 hypothetical protein NSK_005215 [Nannochloropsis salina CCMP1776]